GPFACGGNGSAISTNSSSVAPEGTRGNAAGTSEGGPDATPRVPCLLSPPRAPGRPPHDRPGRSRRERGLTWGLLLPPTPFSATMKAAAAIARILKEERCEYLFCFPISPVIEECARLEIRPIVGRTERTILNMADGYSRASNGQRIGVAAAQHGPGAENAY